MLRFWNFQEKQQAKQIVQDSPKLMVRPMLLAYIDLLIDKGKNKYANTYEIYESLVNQWIEREGDKQEYELPKRQKLKENLRKYSRLIALKTYHKRKEQGKKAWQLSKDDATDVNVELKDYRMTGQSLLTKDARNNWKFAHKSILEFFLAKEAIENRDFALKLDLSGLDMTQQFCKEAGLQWIVSLKTDYVWIKGGEFTMGSPSNELGRKDNETQHQVQLSDFYLCKYAVTVSDFARFVSETKHQTDAEKHGSSHVWTGKEWKSQKGVTWKDGIGGKKRPESEYTHPVIHVSWNDAVAYCKWLSQKMGKHFRLPTEAEWEYACRAGTTTPFHTGKNLTTEQANYDGNHPYGNYPKGIYRKDTVAVDTFEPNPWGLYNMHGNVWEWCSDWYADGYYEQCRQQGTVVNPLGPTAGSFRVLRGGSWNNYAQICRSALRSYDPPGRRIDYVGFRVVFVP